MGKCERFRNNHARELGRFIDAFLGNRRLFGMERVNRMNERETREPPSTQLTTTSFTRPSIHHKTTETGLLEAYISTLGFRRAIAFHIRTTMAPNNAPLLPAPAPNIATSSASAAAPSTSNNPRSRTQAARKRAHADDAAYHAASGVATAASAGTKRAAPSTQPGDEPRVKRKRVEGPSSTRRAAGVTDRDRERREERERDDKEDREDRISLVSSSRLAAWLVYHPKAVWLALDLTAFVLTRIQSCFNCLTVFHAPYSHTRVQVDFSTFPMEALHRYLVQFDIVPDVDPSPLTAEDPPAPSSLSRLRPRARSTASPVPPSHSAASIVTPANRPRRDPASSRRRSSRLQEDERGVGSGAVGIVPVLADVGDVHSALAGVVQKHFAEMGVREVDTLASFMFKLKTKGEC